MGDDAKLGELLLREKRISQAQLKTALDFQKKVGGELREIVIKLGYVKDSVLAEVSAQQEGVGSSAEITGQMIDLDAVRALPRALLEKHQVVPLKGDDPDIIVLAMTDPNNLAAIEEVQFLGKRGVEPAVAPKNAIRKALNQLDELIRQAEAHAHRPPPAAAPAAGPGLSPEKAQRILALPLDRLLRAFVMLQVERGHISADDLIQRAERMG